MRIAQVAPLIERVPPPAYGGTERVVSYLTEELVRRGHDVTLFASGDSSTTATLVAGCPSALRTAKAACDPVRLQVSMIDRVYARADDFDVIHVHFEPFHFALAARSAVPTLTTLHGRLDLEHARGVFRRFRDLAFVSISNDQRRPMPWLDWVATILHGLPRDEYTPRVDAGDYLAFLGRISPEKGCDAAVAIAREAGLPLKIAGKIDVVDEAYWTSRIAPLVAAGGADFVGEVGGAVKNELLARARALLFPICWPEPFGLVMIEAMACGTPVIGFRRASVPEVIEDGVTGFVVDDVHQAAAAVARVDQLDRRRIRRRFEERFLVERMVDDYVDVYRALVEPASVSPDRHAARWGDDRSAARQGTPGSS